MSTAVKVKKPFLPQRKPSGPVSTSVAVSAGGAPRAAVSTAALAIGAEPRVHLLPLDVIERKKLKLVKRRVGMGVLAAVVVVAVGYGVTALSLANAQSSLASAQTETSQLTVQEGKYGQVNKIKSDIAAIKAAQVTGTVQEILWAPFTTSLEQTLPAGAAIQSLNASIDSPFGTSDTAAVPLVGEHIATVHVTVVMKQSTIPAWLVSLSTLKGFVAVTPDSVNGAASGGYTVTASIYLDDKALSNRFGTSSTSGSTDTTTTGGTN